MSGWLSSRSCTRKPPPLLAQQLAQALNVEALSVDVLEDVAVEGFEHEDAGPHVDLSRLSTKPFGGMRRASSDSGMNSGAAR